MKIHHVAITVNNLSESIRFYTEKLGFEVVKEFEREDMGARAVFIKLNNFHIELWQFREVKENKDSLTDIKIRGIRHIAFEVDNLNETIKRLSSLGLEFSEPQMGASGHNYVFSNDPNGVALEFYEK